MEKKVKLSLVLFKGKTLANGDNPIMVRVYKAGKVRYFSTGYGCKPEQFDGEVKNHPEAKEINKYLTKAKAKLDSMEHDINFNRPDTTIEEIERELQGSPHRDLVEYLELTEERLRAAKKVASAHKHFVVKNMVLEYAPKTNLQEITVSWLKGFETSLYNRGVKATTVRTRMKVLQSVWGKAATEGLVDRGKNPFVIYKKPIADKPGKKPLTIEEINKIRALELPEYSPQWHARNYWLFSYNLAGMRFEDICFLTWDAVSDSEVNCKDEKTGKTDTLPLSDEAKEILKYYRQMPKNKNNTVFPLMGDADMKDIKRKFTVKDACNAAVTKQLKNIQEAVGLAKPLRMHIARHSFSNIAKDLIPVPILSQLLRHSSIAITETYLKGFEKKELSEALKKVVG